MKQLFLLAVMLTCGLTAIADTVYDGIIVYVEGTENAYLLSEMPTVTYSANNAILTVDGKQVASFALNDGKEVTITYGKYSSSGISTIEAQSDKVRRVGKYITGGKLIVIGKDGKQYDAAGTLIKE